MVGLQHGYVNGATMTPGDAGMLMPGWLARA